MHPIGVRFIDRALADMIDTTNISDEQIVALCKDESQRNKGFRLLMHKYQERLYWHIRRIVTTHEDADDVIQNVFVKIYRSIDRYRAEAQLYTWMYRVATNESLTLLRKRKADRSVDLDDHEATYMKLKADPYFDGDDVQRKLVAAIDILPDKQKVVFNMRYYDSMSYADISEVLGTSIGALKASYHIAAKKIEKYITQKDG